MSLLTCRKIAVLDSIILTLHLRRLNGAHFTPIMQLGLLGRAVPARARPQPHVHHEPAPHSKGVHRDGIVVDVAHRFMLDHKQQQRLMDGHKRHKTSKQIMGQTIFTASCISTDGSILTQSATVNLVPVFCGAQPGADRSVAAYCGLRIFNTKSRKRRPGSRSSSLAN